MFVVRKEVGGYFRIGGPAGVFVAWFYSCLPHPFPFARALTREGKWNTLTGFVRSRAPHKHRVFDYERECLKDASRLLAQKTTLFPCNSVTLIYKFDTSAMRLVYKFLFVSNRLLPLDKSTKKRIKFLNNGINVSTSTGIMFRTYSNIVHNFCTFSYGYIKPILRQLHDLLN